MQGEVSAERQPKRIRVALWGVGLHAQRRVLPALVACASTELVGITTRDGLVGSRVAHEYECEFWSSPKEMLSSSAVDAVYLATPIGLHAAQGQQVLTAGKHLWCEKSLTTLPEEAAELVELSRKEGLSLCETFMYAYHPQFERIAAAVTNGELGRLFSVTSRFTMPLLENPGYRFSSSLGGGALLDLGCYPLSLALLLTAGDGVISLKRASRAEGFEVDMGGVAVLEFPSSTIAFLEWGYGRAYTNDVTITGELGSLYSDRVFSKADGWEPTVEFRNKQGTKRVEHVGPMGSFVPMLETFARATWDESLRENLRAQAERQSIHLSALRVSR